MRKLRRFIRSEVLNLIRNNRSYFEMSPAKNIIAAKGSRYPDYGSSRGGFEPFIHEVRDAVQ